MRRISSLLAVGSIALGCVLLSWPSTASAHETREIAGGQYRIVVGFMNEPVFAGDKSGLEFWVTEVSEATPDADEDAGGTPVAGLAETVQAEVIYGDQTMALPLEAMFDEPGHYFSVFFPTESEGDYTFRIFGTIGETEIDETFTSGPETFGPIQDPEPLRFPPAG